MKNRRIQPLIKIGGCGKGGSEFGEDDRVDENQSLRARDYFQKCIDGRQYLFMVYWMSKSILAHEADWPKWTEKRNQIAAQIKQDASK